VSYTIGTLVNYTVNKKRTFGNQSKQHMQKFSLFLTVSLINLGLISLILRILVEKIWIQYLLAKIIATGIGFLSNFFSHKCITFKK
jgi:putative flippase GtrA